MREGGDELACREADPKKVEAAEYSGRERSGNVTYAHMAGKAMKQKQG